MRADLQVKLSADQQNTLTQQSFGKVISTLQRENHTLHCAARSATADLTVFQFFGKELEQH